MKKQTIGILLAITTVLMALPSWAQITGISGSSGSQKFYTYDAPSGLSKMVIKIAGGTGDCDLYVKYGSQPTTSIYDYRSNLSGNNDVVTINSPRSGRWYIMLRGYSAYSGVTLSVSTSAGSSRVATPTFSPGSGSYLYTPNVTISCSTAGATIRYTTNGSEPTSSSTQYTGPISVSSSRTIKAKAFKSGMTDSYTASATYTISAPSATSLNNGQTVSSLSGSTGNEKFYKIAVPSGQTKLEIKTWGGSGDCDLYIKMGSNPSTSSYYKKSTGSSNSETITVDNPSQGTWYVLLRGYSAYSGLSLKVTYSASSNADQALRNAAANLGKTSGNVTWNGVTSSGVWADSQYTYCARFVRMCFGESGVYADAISMYNGLKTKVTISTGQNPPRGAVVFYGTHSENWNLGHVGIADGNGYTYSVTSRSTGVNLKPVIGAFNAAYLGYVTADQFVTYH